jgi:ubiquinone/menaquinone biosynthesis C-methylase UbiE
MTERSEWLHRDQTIKSGRSTLTWPVCVGREKSAAMSPNDSNGDATGFTEVDAQPRSDFFIRFLDAGNALSDIKSIKQIMIERLELRPGSSLLDLGCGTGDDAVELARMVGATGTVVGADISTAMITEAKRRHGHLAPAVRFMEADAERLDLSDGEFDQCRAERLLMHLPYPERALAEMVRVLRPGGRLVVFDFDWDTTYADSRHKETTRRLFRIFSDGIRNGWIGRSLPRLFREAGLQNVVDIPHAVRLGCEFAHWLFDGYLTKAAQAGAFSSQELAEWWSDLEEANANGCFNLGLLGFVVAASKP